MICEQKEVLGSNARTEQEAFEELRQLIERDGKIYYLGRLLSRAAFCYPENTALIYKDRSISYAKLYWDAYQFTQFLAQQGVKSRDRVLIFVENSIEFYVAYYGVLQLGAVVAPLNTFLHEKELAYIITDSTPAAIITNAHLKERVVAGTAGEVSYKIFTEEDMVNNRPLPLSLPELILDDPDPNEMAALLYTSGTTGFPKGVMTSSANALTSAIQGLSRINYRGTVLCILPLFHSFAQNGCVWTAVLRGCTIVIVPRIERRALLEGLSYKPDVFFGIPALYGLLCLLKTAPIDSIQYFICGGDALPDKIRGAFELVYGRKICNGYGLTETSPTIALDSYDGAQATDTVGRPLVGVSLEIRNEEGAVLPPYSVGNLWVKGPNVMLGYYNAPELTAKAIVNGWFDTGDLAYIDGAGKLVISGRHKDLIKHKGIKVYPQEIENVLLLHSQAIRAGVVGLADESVGEWPIAFVQVRKAAENLAQELRTLVGQHLAAYKVPRHVVVSEDDLPMTTTGKIDKKVLRTKAAELFAK